MCGEGRDGAVGSSHNRNRNPPHGQIRQFPEKRSWDDIMLDTHLTPHPQKQILFGESFCRGSCLETVIKGTGLGARLSELSNPSSATFEAIYLNNLCAYLFTSRMVIIIVLTTGER